MSRSSVIPRSVSRCCSSATTDSPAWCEISLADVPTELIVYSGEGHGLTTYSQREAKLKRDHKWFEHYMLEKEPTPGSE